MLFVVLLSIGILFGTAGIVLVFMNLGQPFSINNLQPAFMLVAGFVLFVAGAVLSNMAVRIRWMSRIEQKLDEALGKSQKGSS